MRKLSKMLEKASKFCEDEKYTQALKPNIIKAVQIARKKQLQKIQQHENLDLQTYPISKVREDLKSYDKKCSTYYGLMEITNALEKQDEEAKSIDISEVESKIKEVTKEVQKK